MTYREKRRELLDHFRGIGWNVVEYNRGHFLKVPYVVLPDGRSKLSFRTQAVYKDEHSLVSDMKQVDGPALERAALRRSPG
jgi:hypothetical protein